MTEAEFEPRIIAFLCNWCTYTGADLAGTSRIQYPPNVRIIRLMCSGGLDSVYVSKALLEGADGVLIGGCHPGDCHYQSGNYKARRRVKLLKEMHFPHSLGLLYSAFTYFAGFKVNSGEYKLMGLAPYGEPIYKQRMLDELLDLKEDGSFRLNLDYLSPRELLDWLRHVLDQAGQVIDHILDDIAVCAPFDPGCIPGLGDAAGRLGAGQGQSGTRPGVGKARADGIERCRAAFIGEQR